MRSNILKLCIFATGVSGIVAEYILSTLATYFLGDSVFQWAMIVSIMLFSMGLGSRLSKNIKNHLIEKFITIEFGLSIFVSFASLLAYTAAAYTIYSGLFIYGLSITIGIFIGMEIPLVVRLNDEFESLHLNISSVLEKDYYGSLIGGLFFVFVGLPYLGLTYTPFILGMVNFLVAIILYLMVRKKLSRKSYISINTISLIAAVLLISGFYFAEPIVMFGEQKKYKDKIIFSEQSKYQKIVITQWQDNYWLFINGNQQLSTVDEVMYHEPLVHPAMQLAKHPTNVLILGGGDGCAVREILKYSTVKNITLVDLDPAMTELGKNNPVLKKINHSALSNSKVKIINQDAYIWIQKNNDFYDLIIIDLPDPKTVELGRLYSSEFYMLCSRHLRSNGVLVTQAGSPYFATKAFNCIFKTVQSAGFNTVRIHNQVITLGEWGWVIGVKNQTISLKETLRKLDFENIPTKWINNEAMLLMTSFGKDIFNDEDNVIKINKIHDPVLYKYYLKGNWDLY